LYIRLFIIRFSIVENPVKMVVSGKKKKFACHICGKEYNTKQYVKQHVKSIHKQDGKSPITVTIDSKTQQTQFPNNLNGLVGNGQESQVRDISKGRVAAL